MVHKHQQPALAAHSHDEANINPTEQTPLLSESSSETSSDDFYTSFPESPMRPRSVSIASTHGPNYKVGLFRGVAICLSTWFMIFLQCKHTVYNTPLSYCQGYLANKRYVATNMSGMTLIQGTIAEDLNAHEVAMWFTSSFLIAMSTAGPLMGRLGTIFSPRTLVLPVSSFVAIGSLIVAISQSFGVFILGRVVAGLGAGGVMALVMILVLELTSKENRGTYIGLTNAGLTVGVSFGAIVYGGLLPVTGWVSNWSFQDLSISYWSLMR